MSDLCFDDSFMSMQLIHGILIVESSKISADDGGCSVATVCFQVTNAPAQGDVSKTLKVKKLQRTSELVACTAGHCEMQVRRPAADDAECQHHV